MTAAGHNTISAEQLRQIVARIERLDADRAAVVEDMKQVYQEAKGAGFDPKVLRRIIRLRKMDDAERQEQAAVLELYASAIGMQLTLL
jgi:uncharacterized protein (UPF0335 family)